MFCKSSFVEISGGFFSFGLVRDIIFQLSVKLSRCYLVIDLLSLHDIDYFEYGNQEDIK